MKNVLLIILLICQANMLRSQIHSRENIAAEIAVLAPTPYDSLDYSYTIYETLEDKEVRSLNKDMNELNMKRYIGQTIFFLPFSSNTLEKDFKGYQCFFKDAINIEGSYDNSHNLVSIDLNIGRDQIYEFDISVSTLESGAFNFSRREYYTNKLAIAGNYFKILDAKHLNMQSNIDFDGIFYFKLLNLKNNDSLYFYPQITQWSGFFFVGYYEKLKELYLNKVYVTDLSEYWENFREEIDFNTGLPIRILKGDLWKCTDITLIKEKDELYQRLSFIFTNDKKEEFDYACFDYEHRKYEKYSELPKFLTLKDKIIEDQNKKMLKEKNEKVKSEKFKIELIQKYGSQYGNLIFNHKIVIGMTKEMCEISWGKPYRIDKIIVEGKTVEFWSYSFKSFLYFDDEKLYLIKE